ncbi:hypothetical protein DFH09DRAFT_1074274 [Mycena vulgaris]|nr:hypothetical protein DFH09DRAFT_1074274 [Mycena vulgaris]
MTEDSTKPVMVLGNDVNLSSNSRHPSASNLARLIVHFHEAPQNITSVVRDRAPAAQNRAPPILPSYSLILRIRHVSVLTLSPENQTVRSIFNLADQPYRPELLSRDPLLVPPPSSTVYYGSQELVNRSHLKLAVVIVSSRSLFKSLTTGAQVIKKYAETSSAGPRSLPQRITVRAFLRTSRGDTTRIFDTWIARMRGIDDTPIAPGSTSTLQIFIKL